MINVSDNVASVPPAIGHEQIVGESAEISAMSADRFLVTLARSCPFAFAAGPMIAEALVLGPKDFEGFLEGRRKELPVFLKRALQR